MLVFGTYAFPIQTLDPLRYGLPNNVQLQLYCKIGHLFWIPVFPMKRLWIVKINGEKYEPSAEIRRRIEQNEMKKSTPFYAFALPLLIAIGYPSFLAMDAWESSQRQERYEAREIERRQNLLGDIDFPEQGDQFFFNHLGPEQKNYHRAISTAVVEAVTKDSLLLRVPPSTETVSDYIARKYFIDPQKAISFNWVAKADLRKTISLEDLNRNTYRGNHVPGLYPDREITITGTQKGTTEQWQLMEHPEQPLSRFR